MTDTHLSIRLPAQEMKLLQQYCQKSNRTKTGVVREFIRSLTQEESVIEASTRGELVDALQQPVLVSVEQARRQLAL